MNIESMRIRSYRSFKIDDRVPRASAERYRTLQAYDRLRAAGCNEAGALEQLGISRRTLYRWRAALVAGGVRGLAPQSTRPHRLRGRCWTAQDVRAVMAMRHQYPFMGKARLQRMLQRRGVALSVSTVGRIIERALARGAIRPAALCEGRLKRKRRRVFAKWARRWKYGSKAGAPGELMQVDHMTYARDGQTVKEFRAICPVTKFMATRVYARATAGNARRFLLDLLGTLPFPLRSIQVDGGSEFMAQFEDTCQEFQIPLRVLPPRRPQWNGCVERANRSARTEFWNLYDGPLTVQQVAPRLERYEFFYN
ncbi:MAG: helix-turn-helix domain-containing protein [Gammaproteobacteria bacterium]|nr:helix-turn-helix domain-containing protein [Gammaproteobacteria bacterium]